MRDLEKNLIRITIFSLTDSEFLETCRKETSQTIPQLRKSKPAFSTAGIPAVTDAITPDTQYVEVQLKYAYELSPAGLIQGLNALPDRVHTIVLVGEGLRFYCHRQYSVTNGIFATVTDDILLEQVTQILEKINRRIEFLEDNPFCTELKKRLAPRKQQTLKEVSTIVDYASEHSKDIIDANVGSIVMAYRQF